MKEENFIAIDEAIRTDRSFAVYRIPGENYLRFVAADSTAIQAYYDIEELNQKKGFVIAPFHISGEFPIICLEGEEKLLDIPELIISEQDTFESSVPHISTGYQKRFKRFITPLREGFFDKLVLTRRASYERKEDFSPSIAFLKACQRYIRSYVYMLHTPITGTWLGSTPEILLTGEKSLWQTASVAGTQPLVNGNLPLVWSEKNYEEQQLVSDYIYNQLSSVDLHPEVEGPYAIQAGELAHLKSDIRFTLPDNEHLGDLIKLLYPTPAICGLPKGDAYRFIIEREGYDRLYYTGFLGWLDPEGKSDLYINLRCMHVTNTELMLYAGGGLLPYSTASEEWQETEIKLRTMKALIEQ